MPFTTIKKDASPEAFLQRAFANLSPETQKAMREETIKANPLLTQPGPLKDGALIFIPDVPDAPPPAAAPPADTPIDPRGDVASILRESVKTYFDSLNGADQQKVDELLKQIENDISGLK